MTDINPYAPSKITSPRPKSVFKWWSVFLALTLVIGAEAGLILVLPIVKGAFAVLALAYLFILLPASSGILKANTSLNATSGILVGSSVLLVAVFNWIVIKAISHIG